MPSGGLEDMLLAPTGANDVLGVGGTQEAASPASLEDAMLGQPAAAAWPATPELTSGDTIVTPEPLRGPARPAFPTGPAFAPGRPAAASFELDAGALGSGDTVIAGDALSGDTIMSPVPPGFGLPAAPAAPAAFEDEIPLAVEDEIPLSASDEVGMPLSAVEELPLPGGDLEAGLLAPPPVTAPQSPVAAPASPQVVELPIPLHLGSARPGEVVERVLRVPIEVSDGGVPRRTTLEVTLRFKLT